MVPGTHVEDYVHMELTLVTIKALSFGDMVTVTPEVARNKP